MSKEHKRLNARNKRAVPFGAKKKGKAVKFGDQSMKLDRHGNPKGATYEQATGEEPRRVVERKFGQTWDPSARRRRDR